MRNTLTITLFGDRTGPERELWHVVFTYRGEDLWTSLEAGWVGDAELAVSQMLARVPQVPGDPHRLRWALARGSATPLEGQVAETEVAEAFTLAALREESGRAAA